MITLYELQEKQVEHDQNFHRDIFFLNYQDRFKHMVMHYGKYSGRFAKLLNEKHTPEEITNEVKRTLVDCFIIVLSCADLLHLNLEKKLKEKYSIEKNLSIKDLAERAKESSSELFTLLAIDDERERVLNLMLEFTNISGFMLKVAEDLDHMVGFQRETIRDQTMNILNILLIASLIWGVDFEEEIPKRWDILEKRTAKEGPQ